MTNQETSSYLKKLLINALIPFVIAIPLIIDSAFYSFIPPLDNFNHQIIWFCIGLISLGAMLFSGRSIYIGALKSFSGRTATMDTLIGIGTSAAWVYSMFVIFSPKLFPETARGLYFDTALVIIALINLGSYFETRARGKTSQAIKRLMRLQPKTARVLIEQQEVDIPIEEIQINQIIRIRPGEKIAVDGVIIEGQGSVNEAMLTGEPIPKTKKTNDEVIAGTINQTGTFLYRAIRIGKDTVLSRIIELVKKAQNSKPSISRLVDRISWYFVPSVIICAIITALIWYDIGPSPQVLYMLITGMTVLIIACPCALGLGTPLSIMVGVGSAAERGILIRNGDALQSTKKITTVIFDKTGTITQGKPSVTKIISLSDESEDNLLQIAASLEIGSEHPLAEAIKTAAKEQHLTLLQITDFQNLTGLGVIGTIKSHSVMLGNKKLLTKMDVPLENFSQKNDEAATVIYIVRDKKIIGLIFITDPVKPESISAIERLHQMNIKTIMITGDNEITASKIAKEVKIKEFFSELLPGDKLQIIKKQQLKGEIVAMVGDGINDAPALAQANIGYAIGSGTDIAMESADITLMNSSLNNIADSIIISNATMRNIKQNLFGAFIYNMMGIPIAAGILYPFINLLLNPMIAGAAMAFSSVTIVLNANRLRGIIRNLITTPE